MPATSVDTMPVIYPGLHYRDAEAAMGWLNDPEGNYWTFGTYRPGGDWK